MRFASRMKGRKENFCQWRYRGSVNVRWLQLSSPCRSLGNGNGNHFSIDFTAQDLYTALAWHKSPHQSTSLFHEISLPTQFLFSFLKTNMLLLSFQEWNMTMRVRRPLQGTMRKKILSYATQSKKVKKTRKPNCLFCSCECKKLNQSRKRYQNRRQSQRRRQNQKRR